MEAKNTGKHIGILPSHRKDNAFSEAIVRYVSKKKRIHIVHSHA